MLVHTVFWHASVQASVAVEQMTQLDLRIQSTFYNLPLPDVPQTVTQVFGTGS